MKRAVIIWSGALIVSMLLMAIPAVSGAGEPVMVDSGSQIRSGIAGYITYRSGDVIEVEGRLYNIDDVPVYDLSGNPVDRDQLVEGSMVSIETGLKEGRKPDRKGAVTGVILIHGYMLK